MIQNKRNVITDYLIGPRDYKEGVALYMQFGVNLMLKRQFSIDESTTTREILFDELRKIAGLTESEFAHLPRKAKVKTKVGPKAAIKDAPDDYETALIELADSFGVSVDELTSVDFQERVLNMDDNIDRIDELTELLEQTRSKYAEAPEPVRKMIRFREKFPFLNSPSCPDILKVLVADMFTAYGNYKAAFIRLQELGDEDTAQAAAECETIVTEYLANREIWNELEYYREKGEILGKAAKFREIETSAELNSLSDVELIGKLNSATANVSKHKKKLDEANAKGEENPKAAAALEMWTQRKAALKAEMDRRKKKL